MNSQQVNEKVVFALDCVLAVLLATAFVFVNGLTFYTVFIILAEMGGALTILGDSVYYFGGDG